MTFLRSNVEFSKRVFLDRLNANDAPSDVGPGDDYVYAGVYDPFNFGIGADCSGSAGIFIGAAVKGPAMSWSRQFSTETFRTAPDDQHGPFGARRVRDRAAQRDAVGAGAPISICLHHGGGGPESHMNVWIDGWLMESNGTHGTCTKAGQAISQDDGYWNDFWVIDGPITEDTPFRQGWGYTNGADYAGSHIPGAAIKAAGKVFVCRYITDGGGNLPNKRITQGEAADLIANGVAIVSNWESYTNRMREGYQAGHADALAAQAWHRSIGGPDDAVIYFSCDYDEPEGDQPGVNDYLRACCDVLGGKNRVGIYGAYWVCKRALDAGMAGFMWQTEAWSGPNIDARVNIMQRNNMGYQTIAGTQCDIDEAHTDYFGQWGVATPTTPIPGPPATPEGPPVNDFDAMTTDQRVYDIDVQLRGPGGKGWDQLGKDAAGNDRTLVDATGYVVNSIDEIKGLLAAGKTSAAKKTPAKKAPTKE
jgi:hypothetical protein